MREIPEHFEKKREAWILLAKYWFRISNGLGILLTVLYLLIATLGGAAPWPQLRWRIVAAVLPIVAGAVSFLIGTYAAQAKGTAYELAAREIEEAEALYRTNGSVSEHSLGEAEVRGIRLLSTFKLN